MKTESLGYGKFRATNGVDTIVASFQRMPKGAEGGRTAYHLELNEVYQFEVTGTKDDALRYAEQLLCRPAEKPMSAQEMQKQIELEHTKGFIHGVVGVTLDDLINNDIEWLDDLISQALTGTLLLMDISWVVVGYEKDRIFLRVSGDASEAISELTGRKES